jgi:uncharacterized DUF497 family protein
MYVEYSKPLMRQHRAPSEPSSLALSAGISEARGAHNVSREAGGGSWRLLSGGDSFCNVATSGVTIFEWNEAKNRSNLRKHVLDFEEAVEMFGGLVFAEPDTREDYGENRWAGLGMIRRRAAQVVFSGEPGSIRIVSLRKATRSENKQYEKAVQNRLEES